MTRYRNEQGVPDRGGKKKWTVPTKADLAAMAPAESEGQIRKKYPGASFKTCRGRENNRPNGPGRDLKRLDSEGRDPWLT